MGIPCPQVQVSTDTDLSYSVPLRQLGSRGTYKAEVTGSIPVPPTIQDAELAATTFPLLPAGAVMVPFGVASRAIMASLRCSGVRCW
jgi:hypothetical protein